MLEFDTIKELYIAIKNGELQESKLRIVLDNDCTLFYYGDEDNRIVVRETNGYNDIELLYKLLFQKADVRLEKKCSKNVQKI